jgi:hypothetical protein
MWAIAYCDWSSDVCSSDLRKARDAAREYAIEEWGVEPFPAALGLTIKLARINWERRKMSARAAVGGAA